METAGAMICFPNRQEFVREFHREVERNRATEKARLADRTRAVHNIGANNRVEEWWKMLVISDCYIGG
jgi:hypothetical protein